MTFTVMADHPCLPGHFPDRPIVPGVVLLDMIFAELGLAPTALAAVRFMRPVRPGDVVAVSRDGTRFAGRVDDVVVVQGVLG